MTRTRTESDKWPFQAIGSSLHSDELFLFYFGGKPLLWKLGC